MTVVSLTNQPPTIAESWSPEEKLRHSDLSTIRDAQRGDREALQQLYLQHADAVNRYVRGIVRNPSDAEDITHNVFLKLLDAIRQYEPRGTPFSGWLLRVARNAALDYMRARRNEYVGEVHEPGHDNLQADSHRSHELQSALDQLPETQREILILRHFVGLTPGEIAVRLNRTEASVHGLHHRGRAALRAQLEGFNAGPVVAQNRLKQSAA